MAEQGIPILQLDSRFLELDQTTPQSIINGIPLMTGTVLGEGSGSQLVNKGYVDLAVSSLKLTEFFHNDASDIGGIYYLMVESSDTAGTVASAGVPTGAAVNIFNFATSSGKPGLDRLVKGIYDCHTHCFRSVSITRTVNLYFELYKRAVDTTEALLGTSETVKCAETATGGDPMQIHLEIASEVTLLTTDRLVIKWYAIVTGVGGANPIVTFDTGGAKDSHFSVSVNPLQLNTIFVPYTGAVSDVDLGAKNFATTGSIGVTGSRVLKGWFTDLQVTNAIAGSVTGNAGTVTNATLTTVLTVNGGTLTLTASALNTSVLTIGSGAVSVSGSNTGDQTSMGAISDTKANFDTALSDGSFMYSGDAPTSHASSHAVSGADTIFPADPNADRFLMWDDDPGVLIWASIPAPEGTAILSTGEAGGSKYLREDGDGTCSWQTIAADTDEKVKYDALDPTAGYVADKIVAGTGITVAEGTGATENKLVVTNSAPDQTVALTAGTNITSITGTYPNFTINAATQTTNISGKQDLNTVLTELTALTDPNADRVVIWNDTTNNFEFLDYANWNTAYGWGNHASAGYLTSVTAHNLLSTTHGDTTADTVVRGDIITGQGATPKWTRLAFPATPTGKVLIATATDIAWSASALGTAAYAATGDFAAALGADDNYITDAEKLALHPAITLSSLTGFTLTGQALSYTANYSLPLTADTAKGVTANGWGNHASAGYVKTDQTVGQTIGATGARLTKLWATDITCTNAIAGSVTGNAGTVTNATLTTALTVNTGTVTLTGNVANSSVLTIGAGAVSVSGTNTGDGTYGIANTNYVKIDAADVADNDYAKFTANGLEGRSYAEVLSDIGAAATAQTFYIGTTQVAINRASAALTLAGITLTDPVITNIAPAANFTLTQNAVVPFTSVNAGAVVNTLYLKEGKVSIGTATPVLKLTVETAGTAIDGISVKGTNSGYVGVIRMYNDLDTYNDIFTGRSGSATTSGKLIFQTGGGTVNGLIMDQTGKIGLGIVSPETALDIDSNSSTQCLRLRGADATNEIADLFVNEEGTLVISTVNGNDTAQFIDLRPEDNNYGIILRESDGTGVNPYANFYVTDATVDYLSINVNSVADTDGLVVAANNYVGIGTVPTDQLDILCGSDKGFLLKSATNNLALFHRDAGSENGIMAIYASGAFAIVMRSSGQSYVNNGTAFQGYQGFYVGAAGTGTQLDDGSNGASSTTLYIGNKTVDVTAVSTLAVKKNIADSGSVIDKIKQLRVVDYNFKKEYDEDDKTVHKGMIAEELETIFPELITQPDNYIRDIERVNEKGDVVDVLQKSVGSPYKGIKYKELVPYLIKAIQEQQVEIDELKSKLK